MQPAFTRIGAVAAIAGAIVLSIGTFLHPMQADPNDAAAAFAEYAADDLWITSHLAQFAGVVLIGVALVALGSTIEGGRGAAWARIGVAGAAASVGVAAALQAADGVALKVAVDRWAASSGEAKAHAFEAAFAVRQIEIGLAGFLSLLFGLTIATLGVAVVLSRRFPGWLGWLGLIGGAAGIAAGIAQAYTGFSELAMALSMPASLLLLVWAVIMAVYMWLDPRRTPGDSPGRE